MFAADTTRVLQMSQSRRVLGGQAEHFVKLVFLLLFCLCCSLSQDALVECQEQLSPNSLEAHAAPKEAGSPEELVDTLKYLEKLEKLDKYWSEVARPRFGRSEFKQPNYRRQIAAIARQQQMPLLSNPNESPMAELLIQSALEQRQRQRQYGSGDAY